MSKRVAEFDHFFGMKRARSLQSLARELKETTDINTQDSFLVRGKNSNNSGSFRTSYRTRTQSIVLPRNKE